MQGANRVLDFVAEGEVECCGTILRKVSALFFVSSTPSQWIFIIFCGVNRAFLYHRFSQCDNSFTIPYRDQSLLTSVEKASGALLALESALRLESTGSHTAEMLPIS